jgi:DNA-binding XRE family transcriptional regulator
MLATATKMQQPAAMLTAAQIRAARAMLAWTQADLGKASGVAEVTVKKIEAGTTDDPRSKTLAAIQRAFEKAGVVFLEPGDVRDGGEGLRLRKAARRR